MVEAPLSVQKTTVWAKNVRVSPLELLWVQGSVHVGVL